MAISFRRLALSFFARAGPPDSPPSRPKAERSSAVMEAILFLPPILPASATVIGDFMRGRIRRARCLVKTGFIFG